MWEGFRNVVTLTEKMRRLEEDNVRLRDQVIAQGKMIAELSGVVRGLQERQDLAIKLKVKVKEEIERVESEKLRK